VLPLDLAIQKSDPAGTEAHDEPISFDFATCGDVEADSGQITGKQEVRSYRIEDRY